MKSYTLFTYLFLILLAVQTISARQFRVNQLPNGSRFGCANCHVSASGGDARNAFGQMVEQKYLNSQGNVMWGAELAKLDSDGDGITNGQELMDPNGTWKIGQANPGNSALVTNPGDMNSKPTDVEDLKMPTTYSLAQNYPNPFNPGTIISYQISAFSHVTLKVYDALGREVATLVNEFKQPGIYNSQFSIRNLPDGKAGYKLSSGVYFYRLQSGNYIETKRMILLK